MRALLTFATSVLLALGLYAQTVNSISNGSATAATTWDCACVPGATNDLVIHHALTLTSSATYNNVTIKSGASLSTSTSGRTTVNGNLVIESGAILSNDRRIDIHGNYTVNGEHAGSAVIRINGTGNVISGIPLGYISNTARLQLRDGNKTIAAGSTITKNVGRTRVHAGASVDNYGAFQGERMVGALGTSWTNHANSWLGIRRSWNNNFVLDAQATGNTVVYNRVGTGNQAIASPVGGNYFNLEVIGDNVASRKRLRDDIIINGDLVIGTSELDPSNQHHSITLKGYWMNTSGSFRQRRGTVILQANSTIQVQHPVSENFYDLNVEGSDTVHLRANIDVRNSLVVSGVLDMDESTPRVARMRGDLDVSAGEMLVYDGEIRFTNNGDKNVYGNIDTKDLTINANADVQLQSGDHKVRGTLSLLDGNLLTNDALTLVSDENGDARIAEVTGGDITGQVDVQRYIDAGATDWRFLSAPVSGRTLADWNDDFITSGFLGSDSPNFPFTSIYTYDESQSGTQDDGFVAATSTANPINVGEGYWVWCGDSLGGTAPFTIDLKGEANIGNVDLNVQYTSVSGAANDGWSMVGNPYASTIDWDDSDWVKTNMDDAIYIWDPDNHQFASYVNGVGVNGGTNLIASGQAFWVKANAPGPILRAREGVKSPTNAAFKNNTETNSITIALISGGDSDQIKLRSLDGATTGFDPSFDALKMFSSNTSVPSISTVTPGGNDLSINSIPLVYNEVVIPIRTKTGSAGQHVIKVMDMEGEMLASCIKLEDSYTGELITLSEGETYGFQLSDTTEAPRFLLHVPVPVRNVVTQPTCIGQTNALATVTGAGTGPWDYVWYDDQGNVIQDIMGTNDPETIDDLSAGAYSVSVSESGDCPAVLLPFTIEDPAPIEISYGITNANCANSADGAIELDVDSDNGPYQFLWSNGSQDQHQNDLTAGEHSVIIIDADHCEEEFTFLVESIHTIEAAYDASATEVYLSDGGMVQFTNNSTGAVEHTWDFGDGSPLEYGENADHVYTESGTYLATLTSSNGTCSDTETKVIKVIDDMLGLEIVDQMEGLYIEQNDQGATLVINMAVPTELSIGIYNAIGQQIERHAGHYLSHRLPIALDEANGVLLISVTNKRTGQVFSQKILR